MADTYGSVDIDYIKWLIPYVKILLNGTNIKIGFHAHDNMSNATCKALYSLKMGVDMIDGCILGYGRGSGNAKTELIMMNLNKNHHQYYDFIKIIEYGDKYLINYKDCLNNLCYNCVYALSAYFGCHISYAIDIIEKYDKMKIKDIYYVFQKLKENKKEMFYNDNDFLKIYSNIQSI
jgi:4-hydroxy 2-oxovalerate aldolase